MGDQDPESSLARGVARESDSIDTNPRFFLGRPDALNGVLSSPDAASSDSSSCRQQDTSARTPSPGQWPAPTPPEAMSIAVANFIQQLFPSLVSVTKTLPSWLAAFCPHIALLIERLAEDERAHVLGRLRRHMHLNQDGSLTMSLVAMSILRLHPDVVESPSWRHRDAEAIRLPLLIRERLACGKFVPLEHVLYGECLMEGTVCHVDAQGKDVAPEPYPLNVKRHLPPPDFVAAITRSDVMRALMTHGMCLARRFPVQSAAMHGLAHHLWELMFTEKMTAPTAMQLYNAFFQEFEKQLSLMTVLPMDRFPAWLLQSLLAPLEAVGADDQATEVGLALVGAMCNALSVCYPSHSALSSNPHREQN